MKCPTCASKSLREVLAEARNYRCNDCRTVCKRVPKWKGGCVALAFGGIFLFNPVTGGSPGQPHSTDETTGAIIIGLGLVTFGIHLLRGTAGKLEMVTPPPTASEVVSQQNPLTMNPNRLEKATPGDIVLSVALPGWGIVVGLMALAKGEKKRAKTMIAIGACGVAIVLLMVFLGR